MKPASHQKKSAIGLNTRIQKPTQKGIWLSLLASLTCFTFFSSFKAQALPIAFERNYTNYAWGYQNHGCLIDQKRFVYTYNEAQNEPFLLVGRMSAEAFAQARALLIEVSKSEYAVKPYAVDAGVTIWRGNLEDGLDKSQGHVLIPIKMLGNNIGERATPRAEELVQLIEKWCPKTPH